MSSGRIVQIIGAVIDVEFPRDELPKVYDALMVTAKSLTLEVQQQLGDGVVRAIAMGSSEGISRGLEVSNTGAPVSVPVGLETLGRIMDVLGNPIDECGPIGLQTANRLDQRRLALAIQVGIRLVQNHHPRFAVECSRQGDALPLPGGKECSAFANWRVVSVWQSQDEIVHLRLTGSFDDRSRIHFAHASDVLAHAARKELDVLRQVSDVRSQTFPGPAGYIGAVEAHDPDRRLPQPYDEACQRGFARSAGTDDRKGLSRCDLE